jgi:hypothetical protein
MEVFLVWTFEAKVDGLLSVCVQVFFCPTLSNALPVNAASKGHSPIVIYLLTKQEANPLVRNIWGETAYDAAAAVFEVGICEVCSLSSLL